MRTKGEKIIYLFAVSIILYILLSGCSGTDSRKRELLIELNSLADIKDFDDITVSIHWINPRITLRAPLSREAIVTRGDNEIQLKGNELEGKLDWFNKIKSKDIVVIDEEMWVNARFYVVINSNEDGNLLDLVMFGGWDYFIINDVVIERNDAIVDALIPLLDEKSYITLEEYRNWH